MSILSKFYRLVRDIVIPEHVFDFWCREMGLITRRAQAVAKVVKVRPETNDAISIWLRPNANFPGVKPGQHINIVIEINGRAIQRSYSVSGVRKRYFRITARRRNNGVMSSYLNEQVTAGSIFRLGEVWGEATAESFEQKPMLFLAGGIGITPIISIVETWSRSVRKHPVQLVYWGKTLKELAFAERLKKLAQQHSWLSVEILETRFLERNVDGSPKLLSNANQWLHDIKSKLKDFDAFACGSEGFVNQIRESFTPWVNSFTFESFSPILVPAEPGALIQVKLTKQNRTVSIPSGVNVLTALESVGVRLSSGCRRGTCNTCTCNKLEGVVQHQVDKTINQVSDTSFKPCTHSALSDITLEL